MFKRIVAFFLRSFAYVCATREEFVEELLKRGAGRTLEVKLHIGDPEGLDEGPEGIEIEGRAHALDGREVVYWMGVPRILRRGNVDVEAWLRLGDVILKEDATYLAAALPSVEVLILGPEGEQIGIGGGPARVLEFAE